MFPVYFIMAVYNYELCLSLTAFTDYTPIVTTLLFPVNSVGGTTINFEVPIIDDPNCENSETFGLSATIVDNLGNFTAGGDTATGVIIDNDSKYNYRELS